MRSHIVDDTMPADAVVDERTANVIVDAIVSEGQKLERLLIDAGIVEGEALTHSWDVSLEKLRHFFVDHCVVMKGHLPFHYWPKHRRSTQERVAVTLCSCKVFMQNSECEHQYFILGHLAKPGERPDLSMCPEVRHKGRRPKN